MAPQSIMFYKDVGHSQEGAKEVTALLEAGAFDGPKPIRLLRRLLTLANTDKDSIVLDFFSGSATTAHAVMQLNAEDNGNRRYIMVQLPEPCNQDSEAFKVGYKNICEIGKERIRRAGKDIKDKAGLLAQNLDVGFRVFKLDTSNLKIWDNSPITGESAVAEFERRMFDYLDVLVPGRDDVDVVYEVILKLGQDLCEPVRVIELDGNRKVYAVGENTDFIVCLAPHITAEDSEVMAQYAPQKIVFAEQCFDGSTTDKSNVRLTLKDRGIEVKTL
jgi:adenine-specific DNA-methyltransferase